MKFKDCIFRFMLTLCFFACTDMHLLLSLLSYGFNLFYFALTFVKLFGSTRNSFCLCYCVVTLQYGVVLVRSVKFSLHFLSLKLSLLNHKLGCCISTNCLFECLQCFDAVGWAAGRASGP